MAKVKDFVYEKSSTTGTGVFALLLVEGYNQFGESFPDSDSANLFYYHIRHKTKEEWEVGLGYIDDNGDLFRHTVLKSSNADELVNFTSGVKEVVNDVPAEFQDNLEKLSNINVNGVAPDETGEISITKNDIGLGNVNNTSDLNKPISTATQTALDSKADAAAMTTALNLKLTTNPSGITGASALTNIVTMSQAAYDALVSKNATTLYVVV